MEMTGEKLLTVYRSSVEPEKKKREEAPPAYPSYPTMIAPTLHCVLRSIQYVYYTARSRVVRVSQKRNIYTLRTTKTKTRTDGSYRNARRHIHV